VSREDWERADIVLVGVSRVGKTPTCLYLALQYGINAANYPLIPEDLSRGMLPGQISDIRQKLFGFTVEPARLHQMRSERTPDSEYASLRNCQHEVRAAEALMCRVESPTSMQATNQSRSWRRRCCIRRNWSAGFINQTRMRALSAQEHR
jgi:regulator of PEP synthase PpsR (kinase-PPPase family)